MKEKEKERRTEEKKSGRLEGWKAGGKEKEE